MVNRHQYSLKDHNTFHLDVKAASFVELFSDEEIEAFYTGSGFSYENTRIIGGGSNVLLTGDYEGTIVHPALMGIRIAEIHGNDVYVEAAAGEVWDDLVRFTVDNHLHGIENLAYIPGHTGAAPIQNIGAYGVEFKDVCERVTFFHTQHRKWQQLAAAECEFGYRDSLFKHGLKNKAVITSVLIRLKKQAAFNLQYGAVREVVASMSPAPSLSHVYQAICQIRRNKLPEPAEIGNAGSFFKNPVISAAHYQTLVRSWPDIAAYPQGEEVKIAAGWLIEQAGWKGRSMGKAGVHLQQALVLVNLGGASGKDILQLADAITSDIQHKFGIRLEKEVNVF